MSFCKPALLKDGIVTFFNVDTKGQSPLQKYQFCGGSNCVNFGIFGTRKTICDREVAVL